MFSRGGTQFIVFFVLSLLGVWIVYKDLTPAAQGGFSLYDGMVAAMYWFALLLYALLSLAFGLALRRRSWIWLLPAHLFSLTLALATTAALINRGEQYAADEAQQSVMGQESGESSE